MNAALAREIESHRAYLMRVAQLQLRDRAAAEDVVQDTLLAALEAAEGFGGRSSVKTWLTGILKHKVVDAIRRRMREPAASRLLGAGLDSETDLADLDALFQPDGHWIERPADWRSPERDLEEKAFMDMVDVCLERLPPNSARAFVLRELFDMESGEICKAMAITPTNLWVLLFRARVALRKCLEANWFGGERGRA